MVNGNQYGLQYRKLQKRVLSCFDAAVRLVVQVDVANVSGPICSVQAYVHAMENVRGIMTTTESD